MALRANQDEASHGSSGAQRLALYFTLFGIGASLLPIVGAPFQNFMMLRRAAPAPGLALNLVAALILLSRQKVGTAAAVALAGIVSCALSYAVVDWDGRGRAPSAQADQPSRPTNADHLPSNYDEMQAMEESHRRMAESDRKMM